MSFLVTDCTIQKRLYRKGFYIDGITQKKEIKPVHKNTDEAIDIIPVHLLQLKKEDAISIAHSELFDLSASRHQIIFSKHKNLQDTCNDKLILRTGEILRVQIVEVSEENIKYKRCDMLDGPMYSVDVNKVYAIEFRNGHKEYFENKKLQEKTIKGETEKEFPLSLTMAIIIAVSAIVGYGIFLYPLIPFLASNAKKKIKQHPERYKGWELSGCLLTGSIVVIAMILMFFLILFAVEGNVLAGLSFSYLFLFFLILVGIALFIAAVNSKRTPNKNTQL